MTDSSTPIDLGKQLASQLQSSTSTTRANYETLRQAFPNGLFPFLLLGAARQTNRISTYGAILYETFPALFVEGGKPVLLGKVKNHITNLANNKSNTHAGNVQQGSIPHMIMQATTQDLADTGLTMEQLFAAPAAAAQVGIPIDEEAEKIKIDPAVKLIVDAELLTTQRNFIALKTRYRAAGSDYALLFIARHARQPIQKEAQSKYSGAADTAAVLAEQSAQANHLEQNAVFWRGGISAFLKAERECEAAQLLFLGQVERTFELTPGAIVASIPRLRKGFITSAYALKGDGESQEGRKPTPGGVPTFRKFIQ